ncbi:CbtA family protein [Microbaculum marinum]|uniref:CbtA family protein n=1 Tax=Microbaculum marinum TaxID=1764581 RepID=A0AAW9RVG6_9HYPH
MLMRILAGGLIGGIAGGLVVGAIESVTTTPLILHAEQFEVKDVASAARILLVHSDAQGAAGEGGGLTRTLFTFLATVLVAVGYVWMLLAAMFFKGAEINARTVVPWAVAGFFAAGLAPAMGLAPELPGASAAALEARQVWWICTAVATAAGLAAIFFGRNVAWVIGGVVLIALPHVIGAPQPAAMESLVPAELAGEFAARSLVIQALVWIVPAVIAGYAISRMKPA